MSQNPLKLHIDPTPAKSAHETTNDQAAWHSTRLSPADWLVPFPEACISELDNVIQALRSYPQPITHLRPGMLSLTACTRVMSQVQHKIEHQTGLAVVDRIPVERYSLEENKAIGWLLGQMLGQVINQKWNGALLYDVMDSGKPLGYGVRRSVTNLAQPFHTDGAWLWSPPEYVGLFCLQPAAKGGLSRFASLQTVHQALQQHHPELLARLYQPFYWDCQAEHSPNDTPYRRHPVYTHDGTALVTRYYDNYIYNGYNLAGESLDSQGQEALKVMRSLVEAPDHWVEFRIEKGQFQYLNNRQFAHARTEFSDSENSQKRHLLRLWNRNQSTSHLDGPIEP
ncbi:MAG: TauD/TfdA family dioxygenase [Candidatus Tectomicrobia bacterium]|nr:TauD/TfdA family dioxygenase [Candidatus Tectomicrobia bacterium]